MKAKNTKIQRNAGLKLLKTRRVSVSLAVRLQGWIEKSVEIELETGKIESVGDCLTDFVRVNYKEILALPRKDVKITL